MMLEEMELDGRDQRAFRWEAPVSAEARADCPVIVLGCLKRLVEGGYDAMEPLQDVHAANDARLQDALGAWSGRTRRSGAAGIATPRAA
jgi:hypothetical protein